MKLHDTTLPSPESISARKHVIKDYVRPGTKGRREINFNGKLLKDLDQLVGFFFFLLRQTNINDT